MSLPTFVKTIKVDADISGDLFGLCKHIPNHVWVDDALTVQPGVETVWLRVHTAKPYTLGYI